MGHRCSRTSTCAYNPGVTKGSTVDGTVVAPLCWPSESVTTRPVVAGSPSGGRGSSPPLGGVGAMRAGDHPRRARAGRHSVARRRLSNMVCSPSPELNPSDNSSFAALNIS